MYTRNSIKDYIETQNLLYKFRQDINKTNSLEEIILLIKNTKYQFNKDVLPLYKEVYGSNDKAIKEMENISMMKCTIA